MRAVFLRWMDWIKEQVTLPEDTEVVQMRKTYGTIAFVVSVVPIVMWIIIFYAYGFPLVGMIFIIYFFVQVILVLLVFMTRRFMFFAQIILFLVMIVPLITQSLLGGYVQSGMNTVWSLMAPLGAVVIFERRTAIWWFILFTLSIGIFVIFDPQISAMFDPPSHEQAAFHAFISLFSVGAFLFIILAYFLSELDAARQRADDLLFNILPGSIATQLKNEPGTIADGFNEVTVLFADIVDFTRLSAEADPVDVVGLLNTIFSEFDDLAAKYGLEKIKTIGDAYMVAAGLPEPRHDHCEAIVAFAFDMLEAVSRRRAWNGDRIHLRVGINTGPVVAGVIGRQKFIYDLWGDAVNTASRMEAYGMANRIQVTEAVRKKLEGRYQFESRGAVEIKGKGQMTTYFLIGEGG